MSKKKTLVTLYTHPDIETWSCEAGTFKASGGRIAVPEDAVPEALAAGFRFSEADRDEVLAKLDRGDEISGEAIVS